jgi:hypothetical protein
MQQDATIQHYDPHVSIGNLKLLISTFDGGLILDKTLTTIQACLGPWVM